jgi:hypothetical protein
MKARLRTFATALGFVGVFVAAIAPACGGGDTGGGDTFGNQGGAAGKGKAGSGGVPAGGSVNLPDAAGGAFEAGGGTTGFGGSNGAGGGTSCDLVNCPDPPNGAPKCCIVDMCGGDFGRGGCEPFFTQQPGDPVNHRCNQAPPPGAMLAAAPPAPKTTCPKLQSGESGAVNTIISSGAQRTFRIAVPLGLRPEEQLPVVFLWHWLGGDSGAFYNGANATVATNHLRFLAVFTDSKGDIPLKWPSEISVSPARLEEELQYFEDMYGCIAQQYNVQPNCVASAGMSAGGLWTPQLVMSRPQYFASFMTFSGGVGGITRPWTTSAHKAAALVLWGGPGDHCPPGFSFETESRQLQSGLSAGGHFQVECIHNCNHSQPPMESPTPPATKYDALWQFVFDHPYWQAAGQSPYQQTGLPGFPVWCAIGAGASSPRTGACQTPSQCL